MDDLCCVFPVYSNVVLWLVVCPRTFLIRGQTHTALVNNGKLVNNVPELDRVYSHSRGIPAGKTGISRWRPAAIVIS